MKHTVRALSRVAQRYAWYTVIGVPAIIILSGWLARRASTRLLAVLVGGLGLIGLLRRPVAGLLVLVFTALAVPLEIDTGTLVSLNAAVLMVPILLVVWALDLLRRHDGSLATSSVNLPLALFSLSSLLSLVAGNALWDPVVPRPDNFTTVQLGQWGIFIFSAGVFWLAANLVDNVRWLRTLTVFFLALAGAIGAAQLLPAVMGLVRRIATGGSTKPMVWICLVGLAGGQWLFNQRLSSKVRLVLIALLLVALYYGLVVMRLSVSVWAPMVLTSGVLIWLRFPRIRLPAVGVAVVGLVLLFPFFYEFAGGEEEWELAGAPRLVLIERVIKVTLHSPVLGLGPASYRVYAGMEPLRYLHIMWLHPNVSAHNNYVDIFAHTGLVGLGLFLWFLIELGFVGWRLSCQYREGFLAGYVNGMLAVLMGVVFAMALADWFLPFVYNVGFNGFQASVLVWMFLGGLVAVENLGRREGGGQKTGKE